MRKFGVLLFFLFFLSNGYVFGQTDELVIQLNVKILQENSNSITNNVIYESKNELNKNRIYFFILAVFLLLIIVFILKKPF